MANRAGSALARRPGRSVGEVHLERHVESGGGAHDRDGGGPDRVDRLARRLDDDLVVDLQDDAGIRMLCGEGGVLIDETCTGD